MIYEHCFIQHYSALVLEYENITNNLVLVGDKYEDIEIDSFKNIVARHNTCERQGIEERRYINALTMSLGQQSTKDQKKNEPAQVDTSTLQQSHRTTS